MPRFARFHTLESLCNKFINYKITANFGDLSAKNNDLSYIDYARTSQAISKVVKL